MVGKRPTAIYASDACRARGWKERTSYVDPRRANGANGKQRRRSGVQVSYYKAFKVLMSETGLYDEEIERALKMALPERQRALLEQREAA
jgi:hypothetical protein